MQRSNDCHWFQGQGADRAGDQEHHVPGAAGPGVHAQTRLLPPRHEGQAAPEASMQNKEPRDRICPRLVILWRLFPPLASLQELTNLTPASVSYILSDGWFGSPDQPICPDRADVARSRYYGFVV